MVKLVFALHRLPSLSREEFQRYWLETHGPLVRSHAEALGIRRYVQVHTVDTPAQQLLRGSRGAPEEYDGVAELWFDSVDAIGAATATPEGTAASIELLEDERRFIDHARSPLWLAEEHPVVVGDVG
jgi:uncharacterized protein (TIGR02118 family)